MADDADLLTPVDTRCPACSATLRPGAPWCTLCYADLRPAAPLVAPTARVSLVKGAAGADATWPCATCGAPNVLQADVCSACGAGFLARLRESSGPLLVLPVVGDMSALSLPARLGLSAGLLVAMIVLISLFGLLIG